MSKIVAILPCRGRKEQTRDCTHRLLATSGMRYGIDWQLVLVGGKDDEELIADISRDANVYGLIEQEPQLTYWTALQRASDDFDADYYISLANDLLPVVNWLSIAHQKMQSTFSDGIGMVGFNGDGHPEQHSCHFIISKKLLQEFGGWPVWYTHNYGDTEFCLRANSIGRYVKSPWAILFHNHPWISAQKDDEVYQKGRQTFRLDEATFMRRRNNGWK